jgi:hypothetical protein
MRDERTLPFRPPRDLASEARVAVQRSRSRSVAAIDKTLYVRIDRPKVSVAPCTNRAAPNRTGVAVTAQNHANRFGQISDKTRSSSASLLWAGVIAALLTWIAALALCLLA